MHVVVGLSRKESPFSNSIELYLLGRRGRVLEWDIHIGFQQYVLLLQVPRWREMDFTSQEPTDGVEKTEDEIFRKRHLKLEAEERRQLRLVNFLLHAWAITMPHVSSFFLFTRSF